MARGKRVFYYRTMKTGGTVSVLASAGIEYGEQGEPGMLDPRYVSSRGAYRRIVGPLFRRVLREMKRRGMEIKEGMPGQRYGMDCHAHTGATAALLDELDPQRHNAFSDEKNTIEVWYPYVRRGSSPDEMPTYDEVQDDIAMDPR